MPNFKLEKQTISKEETRNLAGNLFEPIGSETIKGSGAIEVENNQVKIRFRQGDVNLNLDKIPTNEAELRRSSLSVKDCNLIRFLNFEPGSFYRLLNFSIENKINKNEIDLDDLVRDQEVYVLKGGQEVEGSVTNHTNNWIKISAEPKTVAALLTLFHEIGHSKDPAERGSLELRHAVLDSKGEEKIYFDQEIMSSERDAWAYSLKKMKPLLEGINITSEELDAFIHKWLLGSYSDLVSKEI